MKSNQIIFPVKMWKEMFLKIQNRFLPEAAETAGACSCSWFIYMDSHFPNSTTGQSAIYFEQSNLLPFFMVKVENKKQSRIY